MYFSEFHSIIQFICSPLKISKQTFAGFSSIICSISRLIALKTRPKCNHVEGPSPRVEKVSVCNGFGLKFETNLKYSRYMDKKMNLKLNGGRSVTGILRGFDPFMNVVIDDTVEECKDGTRNNIGMVVGFCLSWLYSPLSHHPCPFR